MKPFKINDGEVYMSFIKFRKLIDILTGIILILCMGLFPVFIITTYKTNKNITEQVSNVNLLFNKLETSHDLNSKILLETLEFRKVEYRCYLNKENPAFLLKMDKTLTGYVSYVNNDPNLTPEQKKELMNNVAIIEQAVDARIELTKKLVEYDKNREIYIQDLNGSVKEPTNKYFKILDK